MVKISIDYLFYKNSDKRVRKITLPADQIIIEDWYDNSNWDEKIPNVCKVTCGSNFYKAKLSKDDLEKQLESLGVKIHQVKST